MPAPLVLCYHAVSPSWSADLSLTPGALDRQLSSLRRRGFEGVTFSEAVAGAGSGKRVALTFDDCYLSVYRLAAPILERHGFPGTAFAPTDYIGSGEPMSWPGIEQWLGGDDEHELTPMDWSQIRNLADRGWEIGSHTKSHPHCSRIPPEQLEAELMDSKRRCEEELQRPCRSLAYPYGDHDRCVVSAAGGAGYEFACTLPAAFHPAEPLRWPRAGIYNSDSDRRFELKSNLTLARLRGSRALRFAHRPRSDRATAKWTLPYSRG